MLHPFHVLDLQLGLSCAVSAISVMQELLDKCHPLGMFDSISTLAVASNMRELYRLVLVDTPLAPYFAESLTSGLCRWSHCSSQSQNVRLDSETSSLQ